MLPQPLRVFLIISGRRRRTACRALLVVVALAHGPRGSPGHGPCPSGGHVQADPDCRASNLHSTAFHRDEVAPIQPPRTVVESNNLHATCNGSPPDANNHLPIRTLGLVLGAERGLHREPVEGQF